ncbi:MAG: hypothetical protein V4850_22310 [Myxococcota bacterium]
MTSVVIVCGMVGFSVVVGLLVVLFIRPSFIAGKKGNFEETCAALGFSPLQGPSPEYIACGGEVRGRPFLLMPVERPSLLPRRIDILSEAGLALDIASGGVLITPDGAPRVTGAEPAATRIRATLTPELDAAINARLGGRFAYTLFDTFTAEAPTRVLIRSRWPADWHGLLVQTWVDLDADAPTIQAAMEGLVDVRDALARAPGVTERAR